MTVAFYLDSAAPGFVLLAEHAIAAVRKHMPHAEVVHLTTEECPSLPGVDRVQRCGTSDKPFGYRRNNAAASLEGDVLLLDVDVTVRADVSFVFDYPFDVAVTTDVAPGKDSIRFDGGVAFSRSPAFWREFAEQTREMDFRKEAHDYAPLMEAYTRLVESRKYKVLVLPGERYNYVPADQRETLDERLLVHYRGPRKAWMYE